MPEFKPEEMAKHMTDRLKDSLQVNEDQYKKLYDINLKQANEMQEMMDKIMQGEQPQFDREAMQKRQEEQNAAIKAILTEDQYKRYEEMQANLRKRMASMGGGFGGGF